MLILAPCMTPIATTVMLVMECSKPHTRYMVSGKCSAKSLPVMSRAEMPIWIDVQIRMLAGIALKKVVKKLVEACRYRCRANQKDAGHTMCSTCRGFAPPTADGARSRHHGTLYESIIARAGVRVAWGGITLACAPRITYPSCGSLLITSVM